MKTLYGNNKDFNHLLLFGKISNINGQLLNKFFECFTYIFNKRTKNFINFEKNDDIIEY